MEFGTLTEIENVDWTLPKEDPSTKPFLEALGGRKPQKTRFYVGAPIWQQKEWKEKIYPRGMPPSDALFHYSRTFNCIEFNSTHYSVPSPAQIEKWVSQVPSEFRFLPKLPQTISHVKNGLLDAVARREWLTALKAFGGSLGPCFLQLPPSFNYDRKAELFHFLEAWSDEYKLSVEFRHPSWFQDGHVLPALTKYLQSRRIGLVITDVAGRRDVLHSSISAPFSFLRFIGNDLHPSDFTRIADWIARLQRWQSAGLEDFYFLAHQTDNIKSPETIDHVVEDLNRVCGAGLPRVHWVSLLMR